MTSRSKIDQKSPAGIATARDGVERRATSHSSIVESALDIVSGAVHSARRFAKGGRTPEGVWHPPNTPGTLHRRAAIVRGAAAVAIAVFGIPAVAEAQSHVSPPTTEWSWFFDRSWKIQPDLLQRLQFSETRAAITKRLIRAADSEGASDYVSPSPGLKALNEMSMQLGRHQQETLLQLFIQSPEVTVRTRSLALLNQSPLMIPVPEQSFRYLAHALVEDAGAQDALTFEQTLANELLPNPDASHSGNKAAGEKPAYLAWRNSFFRALLAGEAFGDQTVNARLPPLMARLATAPLLPTWLAPATRPVQKIIIEQMGFEVRAPENEIESVLKTLVLLLNYPETFEGACNLLLNTKFNYNFVKTDALRVVAKELNVASFLRAVPEMGVHQTLLSEKLRSMAQGWGGAVLEVAIMQSSGAVASTLIQVMGELSLWPAPNDIEGLFVEKLLSEVSGRGAASGAATFILDYFVKAGINVDATKDLTSRWQTAVDTAKAAAKAGAQPTQPITGASTLAMATADLMNRVTDQWTQLGLSGGYAPVASPTLAGLSFAAIGQELTLDSTVVSTLIGALKDPSTFQVALELLANGSLSIASLNLQTEVLSALLPYIDIKLATPDYAEMVERVKLALRLDTSPTPAVDLFNRGNLSLNARAYLLAGMSDSDKRKLKTGYRPIADIVAALGLSKDVYDQFIGVPADKNGTTTVRPLPGEASADDVLAEARSLTVNARPTVQLNEKLHGQQDLLGTLLNVLAQPSALIPIVLDLNQDPSTRETAYRLLSNSSKLDGTVEAYPALLDRALSDTLGSSGEPPSNAHAIDLYNEVLKSRDGMLVMAAVLKTHPDAFNDPVQSLKLGFDLGDVLSQVDSIEVIDQAVKLIQARKPPLKPPQVNLQAIRSLGSFICRPENSSAVPELCAKVAPYGGEPARALVEVIAVQQERARATGNTGAAAHYRAALLVLIQQPKCREAVEYLKVSSEDPKVRLVLSEALPNR